MFWPAQTSHPAGGVDGDVLGGSGGEEAHVSTLTETAAHAHTTATRNNATAFAVNNLARGNNVGSIGAEPTDSQGGNGAHNNVQPTIVLNYLIFAGA